MKILWAGHRDIANPAAGGAERTMHEVGSRLAARGHDVHVVSGSWNGAPRLEVIAGVTVHRFDGVIGLHLSWLSAISKQPDSVVIDDLGHAFPWFSESMGHRLGTVFFRHLHRRTLPGQVSPPLAQFLERVEKSYNVIYPQWKFVTESQSSASDLTTLAIDSRRVSIIPPGVDQALFRPGEKSAQPRIVYFGGLRDYKRPGHSLLVLKKVMGAGVDAQLDVIGTGPSLSKVRRICNELGLEHRVTFHGRLDRERLSQVVRRAWLNVHCSIAEGWAYSVLEALASGVPTVGYHVPGLGDWFPQGDCGELVRDNEPSLLADAAIEILRSDVTSQAKACRAAVGGYSWERTADLWAHHLSGLQASQSSRRRR